MIPIMILVPIQTGGQGFRQTRTIVGQLCSRPGFGLHSKARLPGVVSRLTLERKLPRQGIVNFPVDSL